MRNRHETILKREDGSVRILVETPEAGRPWFVTVYTRPRRARLWSVVVDWHSYEMRLLAADKREQVARDKVLAVVTQEELLTAMRNVWDLYKPTEATVERAIYR